MGRLRLNTHRDKKGGAALRGSLPGRTRAHALRRALVSALAEVPGAHAAVEPEAMGDRAVGIGRPGTGSQEFDPCDLVAFHVVAGPCLVGDTRSADGRCVSPPFGGCEGDAEGYGLVPPLRFPLTGDGSSSTGRRDFVQPKRG